MRDAYADLAALYDQMAADPAIGTFSREWTRSLRSAERAEVVTCHFDALNHVLREADLQRVFDNVARILREGGLFQFDLNTRDMLRWLGGRQKLLRAGPHWYVADNAFNPSTGVATFRQVWFVARGRLYAEDGGRRPRA